MGQVPLLTCHRQPVGQILPHLAGGVTVIVPPAFHSSATWAISTRGQDHGMLIFDRENWPKHRPWAIVTLLVLLAAIGWYLEYGFRENSGRWRWPSGASPPALSYGLLGGA